MAAFEKHAKQLHGVVTKPVLPIKSYVFCELSDCHVHVQHALADPMIWDWLMLCH